jgi:Na+/proline symporter
LLSVELYQWIILLLFGIGFIFLSPLSKTVSQFFKAETKDGKQPGLWILTASLVISWIFAKSITNAANLGLSFGLVGGVAYAVYYLSFIVAGLVIYNLRVKGGFKSIHDFLQTKFGRTAVVIFSILIGFRLFNEVWSNTMVIGSYFGESGSVEYYGAILVFTSLTLVYTLKGGMRSSLLTDGIQMIFFGALILIILKLIFSDNQFTTTDFLSAGDWKMATGLNLLFVALLQIFSYPFHDPVLTDRGFLGKPKVTLKSFLYGSIIGFVCICLFSLVGVYAQLKGLEGQAAVEVGKTLGVIAMLAMNFIMVTSAASTLDSTFTSFSKLMIIDLKIGGEITVKRGRLVMVLITVLGTIPIFMNAEILSATTISGTMVMGLAPIFLFWKTKSSGLAFILTVITGVLVGIIYAMDVFPDALTFTTGKYAALLWVNIWGSILCFGTFFITNALYKEQIQ